MLSKEKAKQEFHKLLGGIDLKAFGRRMEKALENVQWEGLNRVEAAETVVEDYLCLIKAVHKMGKPSFVELSAEDPGCMIVDGREYDLYRILHSDVVNTERRMEIENLLVDCDVSIQELQTRLNERIQTDW